MSCMIAPITGGIPEIFPIPFQSILDLREDGFRFAKEMGLRKEDIESEEFLGAAMRTDGRPFYLWSTAPSLEEGEKKDWSAGFFAPFGIGDIYGRVDAQPGQLEDEFAISTIQVDARLSIEGKDAVSASWSVRGSQKTVPNKMAIIGWVEIANHGPHNPDDMRKCIALHAPERALGEPRAIVAMQCGVAASCLIEAIC